MTQDHVRALCEAYPLIFRDCHADATETGVYWDFECGDGWYSLIDNLCKCIQTYITNNKCEQITAIQVKEKFGTLRFYYSGGDDLIAGMVWFAEHLSSTICEVCGEPGTCTRDSAGWISCTCEKHRK